MNAGGRLIPYMRKSSGEDPEGSLARQRGAIRAWAESNGVELAGEVWEPGVSGSKDWRERGLGAAIASVERGEAAGIVVEEQSRLSRGNMRQTAEVWEALERAGARLVCTAEGIDTLKGDQELRFAIQAALAREQWKQHARRMADMKRRKVAAGVWIGPPPVGYRKRPDKGLEVDPDVAPVIREVFERWAAGERGAGLARMLAAATGREHYARTMVEKIVRNPIYRSTKLRYGDLESDGDEFEAIVDEPLWHAAQRKPGPARPPRSPWLLAGLACCGTCGHSLTATSTRPPEREELYRYYRCVQRDCDGRRGARAARLEAFVLDTLWRLLGSRVAARPEGYPLAPLVEAAERAERRLEQVLAPEARDALGTLWAADVKARREEHEAALAALGEARADARGPDAREVSDLRERWDDMTREEQRDALSLYGLERVVVHGPSAGEWELMFW